MRIFFTGATGFVGRHLVQRLVNEGHQVRALVRNKNSSIALEQMGAASVLGDLANVNDWQHVLKDIDVVVHAAAPVEFWGPWRKFSDGIVEATQNLLQAAATQGVQKFIHISSESVLQDRDSLLDIDETHPYPKKPNSFYGLAKMRAEDILMTTPLMNEMHVIIIRPPFVWGEGSHALQEIAAKARTGSFLWVDKGQASFEAIHIDNLVEAIVLAINHGKGKHIYFVSDGESNTVREFFSAYFEAVGVVRPTHSLPGPLVYSVARVVECLWRFLQIKSAPPISKFEWAFVGMPRRYHIGKIQRDFGYQPVVSREEGFQRLRSHRAPSGFVPL